MKRDKQIINVSIKGIITNIFLVIFKVGVGLFAKSTAIVLDGLNNFSDTLSSTATIIGIKLSSKKPDKEHPYGHGRIEYFTTIIVALIVFAAGIGALFESIDKIIKPLEPDHSIITVSIIIVAVITKIILGTYVKRKGKELDSDTLIATGNDALFDSVLSSSTLIGALFKILLNINLEGYIGLIIAAFIIKNSIEMIKGPINDIIGIRITDELKDKIKKEISKFDDVNGVYDLLIHNYGPVNLMCSVHIEVDDNLTARDIHKLSKDIEKALYKKYDIISTIGIYASNNTSKTAKKVKENILKITSKNPHIIELHGLFIDEEEKFISFDLKYDFNEKDIEASNKVIKQELKEFYPDYKFQILTDIDY